MIVVPVIDAVDVSDDFREIELLVLGSVDVEVARD
jgi:hypothetical protein